ncbi:hypothetical protein SAMN05216178_4505 [Pseudomonas saponiphila]|uniref:Uncharacterized protein n=1 Tax=Pseudomonas saponiphila TaxID=556534 RepID=A0A1H4UKP4_9PSED|nr:hypothetical protein SAMN05216178_4505 [Pseudomonas saponiphila]
MRLMFELERYKKLRMIINIICYCLFARHNARRQLILQSLGS